LTAPGPQLRQLGEVRRHPPRLILGQQLGRRAPTGFFLEIEITKRLPVPVAPAYGRFLARNVAAALAKL
jgi:hypothetical protein